LSNGDITINSGITLTGGSDATLTLNAARHSIVCCSK
jgi:hypothetical protein